MLHYINDKSSTNNISNDPESETHLNLGRTWGLHVGKEIKRYRSLTESMLLDAKKSRNWGLLTAVLKMV